MSTLTAPQLAALVTKAKLIIGITDDDSSFHEDAIAVYAASGSFTSATIEVNGTSVVATDNVNGDVTALFSGNATLTDMVATLNGTANWTVTLLTDGAIDSNTLVRLISTSVLGQSAELTLVHENLELLELIITNVFAAMETELDRSILSTAFSEVYENIRGESTVILQEPDLTSVGMVSSEVESALTVKYTGTDTHARVEVTDTAVVTTSRVGETTTTTTSLFSGNAQTSDMASTINALSGWTSTADKTVPSGFLVRQGVRDAKDTAVTLEAWVDSSCDFETDYGAGTLDFYSGVWPDRGRVRVDYTAGFSSVPADLEQVLLALVKQQWDAGQKDFAVKKERLGDYSYELGDTSSASTISFSDHDGVLGKYRRTRP